MTETKSYFRNGWKQTNNGVSGIENQSVVMLWDENKVKDYCKSMELSKEANMETCYVVVKIGYARINTNLNAVSMSYLLS